MPDPSDMMPGAPQPDSDLDGTSRPVEYSVGVSTDSTMLGTRILAPLPFPKENLVAVAEEQKEIKRRNTIMNESECYKTSKKVAHCIPAYYENSWTRVFNSWTTDESARTTGVNVWTKGVSPRMKDSKSWSSDTNSRMNIENFCLNGEHPWLHVGDRQPNGKNLCSRFANSSTHIENLYLDSKNSLVNAENVSRNKEKDLLNDEDNFINDEGLCLKGENPWSHVGDRRPNENLCPNFTNSWTYLENSYLDGENSLIKYNVIRFLLRKITFHL